MGKRDITRILLVYKPRYALRTSQTIKQIINKVPTSPYPNILASSESILRLRINVSVWAAGLTVSVQFGTQSW